MKNYEEILNVAYDIYALIDNGEEEKAVAHLRANFQDVCSGSNEACSNLDASESEQKGSNE